MQTRGGKVQIAMHSLWNEKRVKFRWNADEMIIPFAWKVVAGVNVNPSECEWDGDAFTWPHPVSPYNNN